LWFSMWCSLSIAAGPTTYRAVYDGDYNGLPVRTQAVRELKKVAEDRYLLTSSAKSFLASVSEQTAFVWTDDGDLVPTEYQYHRKGIGKNRHAILSFDWQKLRVRNDVESKPWHMDIPRGALDKLSYQLKIRQDLIGYYGAAGTSSAPALSYRIADGGRLKDYRFEIQGDEWIKTPVGWIATVKVIRIRQNSKRSTTFWLARDWEYLLVRLRQIGSKGDGLELLLREARIGGQMVKGLPEQAAAIPIVP
jgi:hypothetical protein